jgi:hypothetical protein
MPFSPASKRSGDPPKADCRGILERPEIKNMQNEANLKKNERMHSNNKDLHNYRLPDMPDSTNNHSSIINYQWKGEPNYNNNASPQTLQNGPRTRNNNQKTINNTLSEYYEFT